MAISALVVAAAAATIALLPGRSASNETFSDQPAQVVEQRHPRLSTAERRRIQRTVDRFVLAALDRSNPVLAWQLAGPDLRGSSSARDWAEGSMPIPEYPARGTRFHGWTQVVVARGSVLFDLLVQPRKGAKVGPIVYSAQVVRRRGGWAVNRWYPIAQLSRVGERPSVVGPNDFVAAGGGAADSETSGALGAQWIAVPVGLFGLALVGVTLVLSRNWLRFRRARKTYATEKRHDLPPLPRKPMS